MNTVKAGLTRKELRHQVVSHYLGLSGSLDTQNGKSPCLTLPYYLNLRGRASIIDTACSSSLVAVSMAHTEIATGRSNMNICTGAAAMMDVFSYISMSSGRMLGNRGRSYTFDHSADGYGRGEGVVTVILESKGIANPIRENAKQKEPWEIMRYLSSALNQDGKSASITAPSGPAQTACIKMSMREAMLAPPEVQFGECHGTGTALGDPIEVGSSRIVNDPYERFHPWMLGATKTETGHLELGAGIIGVLRALSTLSTATVHPNCHLYQLNEHFSLDGYPVAMPCEACLFPYEQNIGGVNSFGFGGTNARHEYWARRHPTNMQGDMTQANKAVKKEVILEKLDYITVSCPQCLVPMDWTSSVAMPKYGNQQGKFWPSAIRGQFESYDLCSYCYEGSYLYSEPMSTEPGNEGQSLYIIGSWTGWQEFEEMKMKEDGINHWGGEYECAIRLGDTRMEKFRIGTDASMEVMIHPIVDNANQWVYIQGPDTDDRDKSWLIDGHADGSEEGTVYKITFTWTTEGVKSLRWTPCEEMAPNVTVHRLDRHIYSMVDANNPSTHFDMAKDGDGLWMVKERLNHRGCLEFYISRDHDPLQEIYPASPDGSKESPALGPDGRRNDRKFVFGGASGEALMVKLSVIDATILVTASSPSGAEKSWESTETRQYGLLGSFSEWSWCSPMETDESTPGVYRGRFSVGQSYEESFRIVVDNDWNKVLYPQNDNSVPGLSIVFGPDGDVRKYQQWQVYGSPGDEMEVTLDLGAKDRRDMVTCAVVGPKAIASSGDR